MNGREWKCLTLMSAMILSWNAAAQNASIPAISEEPGQSINRAPDGSYGIESIDPFTGALKIVTRDLIVPSNGGLDIAITRTYQSLQRAATVSPSYLPGRTTTGMGWDVSFGRLWRSGATQGYTLPVSNCTGLAGGVNASDARYNPVLELPDGSREVLVTGNSGKPYAFITRNRWIGKCLTSSNGGDGGLEVVSPEGIRYIFNRLGRVSGGSTDNAFAFHPTRIEHPNGTAITITYKNDSGSYLRIDEVSHSEGHSVAFSYLDSTGLGARLHTITLDSQHTWTYDYTAQSSTPGVELYYLTKVTRPDGRSFDYSYYTSAGNGQYSLKSIETPLNATVTYTYASQTFPRHSEGAIPRFVVHTKQIGGAVDATGTWTYSYDPADSAGETTDSTSVDGPTNCVVYKHQSATTANEQLWTIGLLLEKSIRTSCSGSVLRREVYDWSPQTLAAQAYWRSPNIIDSDTWAPQLDSLTVTQDGSNYTTNYSSYDEWGNAHHVVESGQDSRTTDRTFLNDTSRWIVNRVEDETISSAGVVYPGGVTSAYSINRTYGTNGDLLSENRSGVATGYSWYQSGTSRGEINTITDAENNTITYSNYKRGTAQNESHPLGISVARVVANAGTITSRTDAAGRTTTYSYNGVNDLTGVGTPRTDDDNISISRTDPSHPTLTRGTYQVVEDYDGLGNYRGSKVIDLAASRQINRLKLLDSEGRVARLYLPVYAGGTVGYDYMTYDGLGRLKSVSHPDGTSVGYLYLSVNRVQMTDERGFITTYEYRSYGEPNQKDLVRITTRSGLSPADAVTVDTVIGRNKLGQVTSVTQGGLTRTLQYNSKFMLLNELDPELGTIVYGRDNVGNMNSRTVGASGVTSYVLDDLYRLQLVTYPGSTSSVDYEYYGDGSLKSSVRGNTRWDYVYDSNNNLVYETATFNGLQFPFGYGRDGRDSLSSVQYPSGLQVTYSPNAFGQATVVSSAAGSHAANIVYFANGQIDSFNYGNGYVADFAQDGRARPTALQYYANRNGANASLVSLLHGYDDAGNLNSIADLLDGSKSRIMVYDGMNRLRTASGPYGVGGTPGTGTFTYDGRNNLMTKTFPSSDLTYTYSTGSGRLTSVTQAGGGAMSFSYDVYGNVTGNGRNSLGYGTFSYDEASNLVQVGSPAKIGYAYDGNNRMAVESRTDGSSSRYSLYTRGEKRLYEYDSVNFEAIDYIYLGGRLVASRSRCTSSADGDGDGLPNCYEWRSGMNPGSAADAGMDADGDGLTNVQEYQAGTNLYRADTDSDGLADQYERRYSLNALVADSNGDADGDTLSNLQEFQLGTRPDRADTDHDGVPDNLDPKPLFNPATLVPIIQMLLE